MSGLDSHGKAMGEAKTDWQISSSSLTAASRASPNPAAADSGVAAHAGGSPVDNEMDEHVPPVIAHVRKNFGILAPTIEPFIYRSGCLNKSVVDVYNSLSRNYIAIVDAALKQVGFEEFTMQMQIMLTQILSEEFGEDTEYLVNTILTYTGADSLFVSLLSKSMLDQVITYAQSIMSSNMYGMGYNMQSGGASGNRSSEGVGNSYYRGSQQQHGYRSSGENGSSRDPRSSSIAANPPHHEGVTPQKPYRSSGIPPHASDVGRERSTDDLRAASDVLPQREESREWGGSSAPSRGAAVTGNVHVESSVASRGGAPSMSGMGAGAPGRTEVSVNRTMSETVSGTGVIPRHTHHHFSSSTAATVPSAKVLSMERGGINVVPQHNLLPPRPSPASSQPRVPTPGAPNVSQNTTISPMPTMGRGGPGILMHHHHHHLGIGAMATSNAVSSDWAGNNSLSGPIPNMNAAGQRTLTPPTPQPASMQLQSQQQLPQAQQPTRTMNIPAPLSVQRRTEKNAAAAAATATPAAAPANGSAPANSSNPNSSSVALEGGAPRAVSATTGGNASVPAPRGAQLLAHHQHHMPVSHHHHHHHHHFIVSPPVVAAALQPPAATHSPPASEERVATVSADSTGLPAMETNAPANQTCASTPAPVRSPSSTSAQTTSAPPPALRGLGRIPLHHHHHHMHLMVNKVDVASARQRSPQQAPATSQPQPQPQPQPQQRVATSIDVDDQNQQHQERTNAANGRWPDEKEKLRGMLLTARVSESAITYLLTDVNIEEVRGLKYVDFEKKLRSGIPLMLDRQRIRQVLSSSPAVQSQSSDNDDSMTSSHRKIATSGVGAEEEASGSGLSRRPPAISAGVQSPVTSHQSSPISKAGVQVPQPRTKMQQQQQQQTQQPINGGSSVASPADASFSSPEKEADKRESATKTGSPTTASAAPTSPLPASTPAPSHNSSYSPSTRNEEPEDSREEEQRRGTGRRGGKRGGLGRGGFSSSRVCRFFGTAEGCQYGDKCHYMHSK
ncbi:hypothetical protein, conserved [Leishmania tarentolae]|uniref:C3H1-type domain-containing protein n=1 Tax=Leishmania tarentolae TaxID=5689 RepID=A0A640KTT4_LEITA|nr:hypothetical protein, conserved [Leishmania tarentolae]